MRRAAQLVIATLFVTLTGCASTTTVAPSTPTRDTATQPPQAVLLGTWAKGQDRLVLSEDNTYLFEREQVCDLPPCPIDQSSGSFHQSKGALNLATVEGADLVLRVQLTSDPRRLTLRHPDGRTWTLPFVE